MNKDKLQTIANSVMSKKDFAKKLFDAKYYNGTYSKKINDVIKENSIDISHFDKNGSYKTRKYAKEIRICPNCRKKFEAKVYPGEKGKITCSYSCSNTYFRSGENNPNWKESVYRTTCKLHHGSQCVICNENIIVSVHHFDEDRTNNSPENLIPLCPTHHMYWHSKHRNLIHKKIVQYRNNFIKERQRHEIQKS